MVIFVITTLELGGAQKVCLSIFEALAKDGQALLIAGTGGLLDAKWRQHPQVILLDSLQNTFSLKHLANDLKALWQICAIIKAQRRQHPELIVHTHSSKAGLFGRIAAWLVGVKLVIHTVHGFGFNAQQSRLKAMFFWLLEKCCSWFTWRYIFVSRKDQTYAQQSLKINSEQSCLIRAQAMHLPVTLKANPPTKRLLQMPLIIGSVSCFKPQKNLIALLDAFGKLLIRLQRTAPFMPPVELWIVGDGKQRPLLENWLQEHRLTKQVKLCGWVNDLHNFYRQIDLFALSSLWEGLPCAAVEALCFHKPVVAFDVGGLGEIVKHGENGFLAPVGEQFLLSQYLELALKRIIAGKAFNFNDGLRQEFSAQAALDRHLALYQTGFASQKTGKCINN